MDRGPGSTRERRGDRAKPGGRLVRLGSASLTGLTCIVNLSGQLQGQGRKVRQDGGRDVRQVHRPPVSQAGSFPRVGTHVD